MVKIIKRKKRYILILLVILFILILVVSFLSNKEQDLSEMKMDSQESKEDQAEKEEVEAIEKTPPLKLSAWLVDWKKDDSIEDYKKLAANLASAQIFGVYFNQEGSLLLTDNFHQMANETITLEASIDMDLYFTIVNDRILKDGTSMQKDPQLIYDVLGNEAALNSHIEEIIDVVMEYDFDGVEIDYEKIPADAWGDVSHFYSVLYDRLEALDIGMRVVLEPSAPVESLDLPVGPSYVVMAYNLFGYHTGPGPKADTPLIEEVAQKLKYLPEDRVVALSLGGFDWREDGETKAITEEVALKIISDINVTPTRDENSKSVTFQYTDHQGFEHTVWYADHQTIKRWIEIAELNDIHQIALWRLGEMDSHMLDFLSAIETVEE